MQLPASAIPTSLSQRRMSYVQTDSVSVNDQQALLFAYALNLLIELIIGT